MKSIAQNKYNSGEYDLIPDQKIFFDVLSYTTQQNGGTGIITSYKNRAYFITAKHILDDSLKNGDHTSIEIDLGYSKTKLEGKVHFHKNLNNDIAVIELNQAAIAEPNNRTQLHDSLPITVGQKLIFLGYPLGFSTIVQNRKVALVKQAILSGSTERNGCLINLLDGHNNPGFSGGPVFAKGEDGKLFIVGIISGYFIDPVDAEIVYENKKIQIPIKANSGIILSVPIDRAIEIIKDIK